jgi:ElaB/YqjD/DUF883 family membrane-anchored ribosome-binding protein
MKGRFSPSKEKYRPDARVRNNSDSEHKNEGRNEMKTEARIETMVKDLKHLSSDAENLVKAAGSDVSEATRAARRRLAFSLESARESCCELQEKARNGARATDKLIRHNPYQTAGIAFGLGLLLGVMAMARRN